MCHKKESPDKPSEVYHRQKIPTDPTDLTIIRKNSNIPLFRSTYMVNRKQPPRSHYFSFSPCLLSVTKYNLLNSETWRCPLILYFLSSQCSMIHFKKKEKRFDSAPFCHNSGTSSIGAHQHLNGCSTASFCKLMVLMSTLFTSKWLGNFS